MDRPDNGLVSVISVFCIGLVSGAAGGLLLGATAVVVLQSLELLADNRLLMDQLEQLSLSDNYLERMIKELLQWESNNEQVHVQISIFSVMFGVFSSVLSLAVGTYVGLATYSLVIQRNGEAARGKALAVAGPVCLMGVTATGYILGVTLESFLSISFNGSISLWAVISVAVAWLFTFITEVWFKSCSYKTLILFWIFTPGAVFVTLLVSMMVRMRFIIGAVLMPMIIASKKLEEPHSLKLTGTHVRLMLIISDVYNIAGQQIVALQSPTSTTTSSVVVEAIFVGVLTSLMWTVTVGMSLFVAWQRGGAGKICATAAATGSAVLGVIRLGLPVLGPGPTIGALIGVAGAAGVSLAAADAATDQYQRVVHRYGWFGRLGVTVGAAVGAFLPTCAHSGLSGMFMALCAATVPAGAFLKLPLWGFNLYSCIYLLIPVVLMSFSYTVFFCMMFKEFGMIGLFYVVTIYALMFWYIVS